MEKLFYVIRQITQGAWLIDPGAVESHYPLLRAIAEGRVHDFIALWQASQSAGATDQAQASALPVAVSSLHDQQYYTSLAEAPAGSKSLIRIEGAIMKRDYCGTPGTATLAAQLLAADKHENISGHMIIFDSPGGTVDGTMALAEAIKNTKKPVIGFVDQMQASAAYWIGSACNELVAINETALIGSIGTMIRLTDSSGRQQAQGVKEHIINADTSPDKNGVHAEAFKNNYTPIKEELLNPLNEIFLSSVRANRPGVNEKALTGKVFLAQDALSLNLINHIGNFEFALERLEALILERQSAPPLSVNNAFNQIEQQEMFTKNKFPKLLALATLTAVDEATLNAVNEELAENNISAFTLVSDSALQADQDAATAFAARITELEAANSELTAERDAAQALAIEYGAKPGAKHTETALPEGDAIELTEEQLQQKAIDELPHNRAVDNNPLFRRVEK